MKAIQDAKWKVDGDVYEFKAGEEVKIKKAHEAQAKASGLFEVKETKGK